MQLKTIMNYLFSSLFGFRRHVRKSNRLLKFLKVLKNEIGRWFVVMDENRTRVDEENKQWYKVVPANFEKWLGWANTAHSAHAITQWNSNVLCLLLCWRRVQTTAQLEEDWWRGRPHPTPPKNIEPGVRSHWPMRIVDAN